ncbi:unnamed protein product [Euphydryas editha]|nr:unnamed protein product [Euphydryas editha]
MRASISAKERLVVTLRYLATGTSLADLEYRFRMGKSTLSVIIREVCSLIWSELYPKYMKMPCINDWLEIANKFEVSANFPHCVGAVDGKHIRVIKPNKSGSMFLNYKHYFSIVLMAVADSDYNFIYISVGAYGKDCDSGVFKDRAFWHNMINNTLNLPGPTSLPNTNIALPYVFVGDEAFALHQNLLRPYNSQMLDAEKSVFNYRLTRARRYVECTFGILANKWRIFHRPLNVSLDLAVDVVKACCLLQNFIHKEEGVKGVQESLSGCELEEFLPFDSTEMVPTTANEIREKYKEYFNSEYGSVPWQNNYC